MASTNRSALITKLLRVVRKRYTAVTPVDRPVLEQLIFAGLLENAPHEPAEEAFAALLDQFFDWNEVRVSTVRELAEVMRRLPAPEQAANRVKNNLQNVFESRYTFDLEDLKRLKLGQAEQKLEKIAGVSKFCVAYVTQVALGGHSIPLDEGTLGALEVVGIIDAKAKAKGVVPGLERAVPKAKGTEVASLIHLLGADFFKNPYAPALHKILLEINPDAKENLPKRPTKKQLAEQAAAEEAARQAKLAKQKKAVARAAAKTAQAAASKKKAAKKVATVKKAAKTKKSATKKKAKTARRPAKRKPR